MNKINTSNLGWLVAAVLAGVIFGGGFQSSTEKFGVADLAKVAQDSDYYVSNSKMFDHMVDIRRGLLDFFNNYKVLTSVQVKRIQELTIKDDQITASEKAELERIKSDGIAQDKRYKELTIKANPTPEERTLMEDFTHRAQAMDQTLEQLRGQFDAEVQTQRDKIQTTALERARDAVRDLGKSQGYTVIMSAVAAPYGANDITDAALKAMNAKK